MQYMERQRRTMTSSTIEQALESRVGRAVDTFQKSVILLDIDFKRFGTSRKVNEKSAIETEADKTLLSIHKKILDSKEQQAIEKYDRETVKKLKDWTLPSIFGEAIYPIPTERLDEVILYLNERKTDRERFIDAFADVFWDKMDEAQRRLGPLFRSKDYPRSIDQLRSKYGMEWGWIEYRPASALESKNSAAFEMERQKFQKKWEAAYEASMSTMRLMFKRIVDHLYEVLANDKQFQKSTVEKFEDFFRQFDIKNSVLGDTDLEKIVEDAKLLMRGVSPADLRESTFTKSVVQDGLARIKEALDNAIDVRSRAIDLD